MTASHDVIIDTVLKQRQFFESGTTKSLAFRLEHLMKLQRVIKQMEQEIAGALFADLHKSSEEAYLTEIGIVLHELRLMIRNLPKYAKNKRVKSGIAQMPAVSFLSPEPYGVCLVMSPWNYPFQLSMVPLIAAVAAGNCVVLKPSADAKNTSEVMQKIIKQVFAPEHVSMVTGGRAENTALLEQRFDYIFFTGSVQVGKVVMAAAAKHLTPVTLELGGKSPVIVDETADILLAARRIAFGKLLNAGQTCVAPDYLLVQETVKDRLMDALKAEIRSMVGDGSHLAHIINEKHASRIKALLAKESKVMGGETDGLFIAPVLVELDTLDSDLMKEEIFGPVLPVISYRSLNEAIQIIKTFEKPLALYLFSNSKDTQDKVLREISFGGGCINDTVLHYSNPNLPFGGVGESGMGSYHGKRSFDTFTHYRGILKKHPWPDISARYLPYSNWKTWLTRLILR